MHEVTNKHLLKLRVCLLLYSLFMFTEKARPGLLPVAEERFPLVSMIN